jgi:hypothetical protein
MLGLGIGMERWGIDGHVVFEGDEVAGRVEAGLFAQPRSVAAGRFERFSLSATAVQA